ncbi:hypothetical protein C1646_751574 [Rhizophagus diaphanus]|nr:hypothetical protein C1646_751574 [Rhizophagus diaphanus] [Rhizophagus sp. MUCL 43196]
MEINYNASSPLILSKKTLPKFLLVTISNYGKYAQVLVPNGQILFIGGQLQDGRVVVFGEVSKPSVPALPHIINSRNVSNNDPLINSENDDLYKLNVTNINDRVYLQ